MINKFYTIQDIKNNRKSQNYCRDILLNIDNQEFHQTYFYQLNIKYIMRIHFYILNIISHKLTIGFIKQYLHLQVQFRNNQVKLKYNMEGQQKNLRKLGINIYYYKFHIKDYNFHIIQFILLSKISLRIYIHFLLLQFLQK